MRGTWNAKEDRMYLAWFDDHPKKETRYKISEAIYAYEDRFGQRPNVVLVNATQVLGDSELVEGVKLEVRPYVRKHNFWVGMEMSKQ